MAMTRHGRAILGWAAIAALGALPAQALTKDYLIKATANADHTYSYSKTTNWTPSGVPGTADIARFNRSSAYTLILGGVPKVSRIFVGNDNLIMDLRGGSFSATSTTQVSLQMGIKSNDVSRLQIQNGTFNTGQGMIGAVSNSSGSVTVATGGVWNGLGALTLGSLGTGNLTINGGGKVSIAPTVKGKTGTTLLKLGTGSGTKGMVLLSGTGSQLSVAGNGIIGSDPTITSPTAGLGSFYVRAGAKATFDDLLDVRKGGDLRIEGGTLTAADIQNTHGGKVTFTSGVINILDTDFLVGTVDPRVGPGFLGNSVTLTASQTINVLQNTLLAANAVLIMQDGKITTNTMTVDGELRFNGLNSVVAATEIDNSGLISGRGQTAAIINNNPSGEIRATGYDKLTFSGTATNAGLINVQGTGTLSFTQRLTTSGTVNVSGLLGVPAGLNNSGQLNFTAGAGPVAGSLNNTGDGKVSVNGTTTQFQSDVTNNGSGFAVSSGSRAVFSGNVSGYGNFTGDGILEFLKDSTYSPGAALATQAAASSNTSSAHISMANNVQFDAGSKLYLDLGPAARDTDQIINAGNLQLADVNIIINPGFSPLPGDVYTLLSANHISYNGQVTVTGNQPGGWQLSATDTTLQVSFVPEPSILAGFCLGATLILGRRRRQTHTA